MKKMWSALITLGFVLIDQGVTPLLSSAQTSPAPEQRLQELGFALPQPTRPVANFVTAVRTGNLLFVAGHGPCGAPEGKGVGKVGRERTIEEGYDAARQTAL